MARFGSKKVKKTISEKKKQKPRMLTEKKIEKQRKQKPKALSEKQIEVEALLEKQNGIWTCKACDNPH